MPLATPPKLSAIVNSRLDNGGKSISIEEIRSLTSDQWEEHRCYKNGTNDILTAGKHHAIASINSNK